MKGLADLELLLLLLLLLLLMGYFHTRQHAASLHQPLLRRCQGARFPGRRGGCLILQDIRFFSFFLIHYLHLFGFVHFGASSPICAVFVKGSRKELGYTIFQVSLGTRAAELRKKKNVPDALSGALDLGGW